MLLSPVRDNFVAVNFNDAFRGWEMCKDEKKKNTASEMLLDGIKKKNGCQKAAEESEPGAEKSFEITNMGRFARLCAQALEVLVVL